MSSISAPRSAATYQFGPFLVNSASGELFKDGRRVRLQDQPFRLLVVLLEQAGNVVSREEIQRRIWPENTFVDFDGSLRVAVRKLREALGDDAERPVYVETIPKRGYRFLIPATPAAAHQPPAASPVVPPATSRFGSVAAVVVAALLATAVSVYWLSVRRQKPVLSDKDTVLLADFTNTTGDPVFDTTLRQGLVIQLEQSPFLSLVSEERIQQTLLMMAEPPNAPLTPEIARAVCERTSSAAMLDGSIARLGSEYVVGLRATSCRTGETLDAEQAQASRKEDVLHALDQIAGTFRRRLGESLATVNKYDTPLADATTSSLDALRAYSAAQRALYSTGSEAAIPLFKQAVDFDPGFAMAHAWLGRKYGDVGEFALSAESTTKAYHLRDRVSLTEQYFISASYDLQVSGNLEKAERTCRSWVEQYPRALFPNLFLAGIVDPVAGRFDRTIEDARRAIQIDPDFAIGYYLLAYGYQYASREADAVRTLDTAEERHLNIPEFLVERYDLAFLQHDRTAMDRAVSLAHDADAEPELDDHQAFVLAYAGQLREAVTTVQRAAAMALQAGERERAAQFETGQAVWNGFFGNAAAARRAAASALGRSNARDVEYGAAVALALAQDSAGAQKLANDLERRFPEDTDVRFNYLPTIHALVALNDGQPAKAIEQLQMAVPYELAVTRSSMHAFFGALYPVYVRGLAYLGDGRGAAAAAQFQKILERPGLVVSDPIGALARYQLARAYSMAGDSRAAKSAYEEVLGLWNAADPDLPVVTRARNEYAALQ